MRYILLLGVAAALAGCAMPGLKGGGPYPVAKASIPFPEFGAIYDWRGDGTKGIYIESDAHKWYYATFMAPCDDLPDAQHVGFRTTPPLPLDKFDSIEVLNTTCYFQTFDASNGPPGTKLKAK